MTIIEGSEISELSNAENQIAEGEHGEIRLYMDRILSADEITRIQDDIVQQGVLLTSPIVQEGRILSVHFEKRIAPLLIIGGAAAAITTVLGWQVFKARLGLPWWVWAGGIGLLLYLAMKSDTGQKSMSVAKMYVTREVLKNPNKHWENILS